MKRLIATSTFCLMVAVAAVGQEQPKPTDDSLAKLRVQVNRLRIATEKARAHAEDVLNEEKLARENDRTVRERFETTQAQAIQKKIDEEKASNARTITRLFLQATVAIIAVLMIGILAVTVLFVTRRSRKASLAQAEALQLAPRVEQPPEAVIESDPPLNPDIGTVQMLAAQGNGSVRIFLQHEKFPEMTFDCVVTITADKRAVAIDMLGKTIRVRWTERYNAIARHYHPALVEQSTTATVQ